MVLRDTTFLHSEIRYQPYFSSICFWYNREVLAIVCSPFLLSEFDPRAISGSVLLPRGEYCDDCLLAIRPAKGSEKREKPVSPMAPHPQSELHAPQSRAFDRNLERLCRERRKTIASYQKLLEKWRSPVGPESVLPLPKNLIAAAIYQEIMEYPSYDRRSELEIAYVQLESFIPDEEYRILSEFKNADKLALELAATGGPANVLAAVSLLKKAQGDSAVRIQRRISWKMRCRLKQIRKLCA